MIFNIVLNSSVSKAWIWLFAIVAFDLLILAIYLHKKKKKAIGDNASFKNEN
jgi:hypothetical protein